MTTNITTLAINLLISERANHRGALAEKIVELVQPIADNSEKEKELKNNFYTVIAKCVENPSRESADLFYKMAQFYNEKVNGATTGLSAAA